MMSPPLLLSRRFAPLFSCQFFAAFNDNLLRIALVFLILFRVGGSDTAALAVAPAWPAEPVDVAKLAMR